MRPHTFVLSAFAFAAASLAAVPAAAAEAEQATEAPKEKVHIGGYGGPMMIATTVLDEPALLVGGRGAVFIDRRFSLGGGGFGLVNPIDMPGPAPGGGRRMSLGGGGFWMQYDWAPDWKVHPTTGLMIGGASFGYDDPLRAGTGATRFTSSAIFFVTPEIGVDFPIVSFLRAGIDLQYRFASGVDLPGLSSSDASGPGAALHLKFGAF